jgi:hypothetical protein
MWLQISAYYIFVFILFQLFGRGGVAELVARPPMDPKVCGSNPRGPEYSQAKTSKQVPYLMYLSRQ